MKVKPIKVPRSKSGVKLYALVQSEVNNELYTVVYIRTPRMRRWLCDCYNQVFTQTARRRNCKHIRAVRQKAGL